MILKEGDRAPDFTLNDDRGEKVSLSNFSGKKVVLYFYPRDNTPGCTKEACSFRDEYDRIMEKGAVVIGVSKDSEKSHQKFRLNFNLPFYLLSDPEHLMMEQYGAWGEKKIYGKTVMGTLRITYIIDEEGKVLKVFPKVKPKEHALEIMEYL